MTIRALGLYNPQTAAAKAVKELMGDISTAQQQWETYATQLGRGYSAAYLEHEEALKGVQERYRLAAESAYWVLSLLCVSVAGGLVGGLMAPWVGQAGTKAALTVASTISGTASQSAQIVTQRGIDVAKAGGPDFKPAVKPPHLYWQDLLGEIGIACSTLRKQLDAWMRELDQQSNPSIPEREIDRVRRWPLLDDCPFDFPDPKKVAVEAELGMWVAWANVRKTDYWKSSMDTVSTDSSSWQSWGNAISELVHFEPVVAQLRKLGAESLATRTVERRTMGVSYAKHTVLDIPKLQIAGNRMSDIIGNSTFVGSVAEVVKQPHKVLDALVGTPPRYKLPGRRPIKAGPAKRVPIAAGR